MLFLKGSETFPVRLFFWLLLFAPLPVWAASALEQSAESSLDFLYVNANAGEAAGGHTALRLGDSVFHYQFFPDNTFLLVREPWDHFRFLYNDLHNRSIALASLPLDPEVYCRIRNHFTEQLIGQQQFFDTLQALQEEDALVGKMLAGRYGMSVLGLGFFKKSPGSQLSSVLAGRIAEKLGEDFLQQAAAEAEETLQRILAAIHDGERAALQLKEQLELREALRVLGEGWTLDVLALITPLEGERGLNPLEKEFLEGFGENLVHSIVELLQSRRPDRGESLLLQTARYLVVRHSLAAGRLYTLDPFPDNVPVVELTDGELTGEGLLFLQEELFGQAEKQRSLFFQQGVHPELAYSFLETARARAWELEQAGKGEKGVRILARVTLPSRGRMVSLGKSQDKGENITAIDQSLTEELQLLRERSEELYGYNLFLRNCATELIRSLNSAFPDPETGRTALGGWLEPDSTLLFIPFLFYEQSLAAFPVQEKQILSARRLHNLEYLYQQENDLLVWFRESNTFTSTLYEPRSTDTPFLFFTDDTLFLRPIQGFFNLAYAILYGAAGMVTFPLDDGERFRQAGRGIFYSLPELGFGNIRKGSYSTADNMQGR